MTNTQTTDPNQPHCEQCGRQNPGHDEGYTGCCNERVCSGPAFGKRLWITGHFDSDGDPVETGTYRACCSAVAESATGLIALRLA